MIKQITKIIHIYGAKTLVKDGSSEIPSILYAFVKNNCENLNELTFWCDNCGGQNENQYIAQALIYTVNTTNIKKVDLKFPYKGHTFLADNSNFGNTEKKYGKKKYFIPLKTTKRQLKVHILIGKMAQVKERKLLHD